MAKGILVSSVEGYSGKSGIIIALGLILRKKGLRVGYFKPFGVGTTYVGEKLVDEDSYSTAQVLDTGDNIDDICPVLLDSPYIEFVSSADPLELKGQVLSAYKKIAEDKDVILIEGALDYDVGRIIGLSDVDICSILEPEVLMIAKYTKDFVLDKILVAKEVFGEKLKTVIFNQLGGYKRTYVQSIAIPLLAKNGLEVVGMLPNDPVLSGLYISEIKEGLQGEFLVEPPKDTIVERFLIGAMSPQSAMVYFRATRNAAVVTGGDRSDLQIVALETPNVKCLLLTGNLEPSKVVLGKAEEKGIPIVLVKEDTLSTIERLDEIFGRARIKGEPKIKRIKELVKNYVEVDKILEHWDIQS
ncbi:MAG: phosphotransacetylase family protein [Archaeoglobaceae archaeon]